MAGRSLIAAGLISAVAAAPASAEVPRPASVARSVEVRSEGVTSLTLRCPRPAVALAGAVTEIGAGVAVRDSVPAADARTWTFRFTALQGSTRRGARAVLRCVSLAPLPGMSDVRLNVASSNLPDFTVAPLSTRRIKLTCARGYVPTGWGLDRGGQDVTTDVLPTGEIRLAAAVPVRDGWVIRIENTGGTEASGTLRARCLQRRQTGAIGGDSLAHRFAIRRAGFRDRVPTGGSRTERHACRAGEFSVMTGHALDAGEDIMLSGTYPSGQRRGTWKFKHASGAPEPVRTYLLCMRRDTTFR